MKIKTGVVKFSYVNIFEPKSINGNEAKFSISLIIPKKDKKTIDEIKKAIEKVTEQGTAKFGGRIPVNLKTPLRDGDIDRPDDAAYANSFFVNCSTKVRPAIVDKSGTPILNPSDVYSGCYGRAIITFYSYNFNGNKGIGCGIHSLQKISDGVPLGRTTVDIDFGDYDEIADESFN